jgi:hypothetical protein
MQSLAAVRTIRASVARGYQRAGAVFNFSEKSSQRSRCWLKSLKSTGFEMHALHAGDRKFKA